MEQINNPDVITTRTAKLWLDDLGIIHKVFLQNATETKQDALECEAVIKKLSNGVKHPMLVDFTALRSMDGDARDYYVSERAGSLLAACGGVTRSTVGRVISNFFIGFNKPPTPVKLFNSEEQSIEWLKQFAQDN
ncbi:MAG: hypothetical protein JKY15_06855 [Deltaproteobacteria bacterium]|nr:hypothetical protein [Deltaproteobacteria bacterium]